MTKRRCKGCPRRDLFKSDLCWKHIVEERVENQYKELILQPGKDGRLNLRGANLCQVLLVDVDLREAKLDKASLREASLYKASFEGASVL